MPYNKSGYGGSMWLSLLSTLTAYFKPYCRALAMQWLLLAVTLSFSLSAQGAYKIVSLYEQDALVTGRFLPFKVYDDNDEPVQIVGVAPSEFCYGMVDSFRDTIFHLYCRTETTVSAQLVLGTGEVISLANLNIRKLSIIDPDLPIEGPGGSTLIQIGKKEFQNNCLSCHSSTPIRNSQTKDTLLNVQFKKDAMKNFGVNPATNKGFFTDEELEGLVLYINEEIL